MPAHNFNPFLTTGGGRIVVALVILRIVVLEIVVGCLVVAIAAEGSLAVTLCCGCSEAGLRPGEVML